MIISPATENAHGDGCQAPEALLRVADSFFICMDETLESRSVSFGICSGFVRDARLSRFFTMQSYYIQIWQ